MSYLIAYFLISVVFTVAYCIVGSRYHRRHEGIDPAESRVRRYAAGPAGNNAEAAGGGLGALS